MNILAQDKPIIKYSVKELMKLHTIYHYEVMGLTEEMHMVDPQEDYEEYVDIKLRRNKAMMMYELIKGLLSNYDQLKKHSNYI